MLKTYKKKEVFTVNKCLYQRIQQESLFYVTFTYDGEAEKVHDRSPIIRIVRWNLKLKREFRIFHWTKRKI